MENYQRFPQKATKKHIFWQHLLAKSQMGVSNPLFGLYLTNGQMDFDLRLGVVTLNYSNDNNNVITILNYSNRFVLVKLFWNRLIRVGQSRKSDTKTRGTNKKVMWEQNNLSVALKIHINCLDNQNIWIISLQNCLFWQ